MTYVKICGITRIQDALAAKRYGADALGFVFAPSPRRVWVEQAKRMIAQLGPFVPSVGVFVNENISVVNEAIRECRLDAVQLHGDETPEYTRQIRGARVIKAIRVRTAQDLKGLKKYSVDAYLFDARIDGLYGGTGRVFDWSVLKNVPMNRPWILSGGLNVANVSEAIRQLRPYALDVSSSLEKRPGIKDEEKLKKFLNYVKKN